MKRSGKFYRKNEEEVMKQLGLKPTKNSGSGWVEKEDGQNEAIICQLKSTDANSIRINQQDIRTLEYNASVSHKLPVFAIQFLNTGEVWLLTKPDELQEISNYLKTGTVSNLNYGVELSDTEQEIKEHKMITSSKKGRTFFYEEKEKELERIKDKIKKERKEYGSKNKRSCKL